MTDKDWPKLNMRSREAEDNEDAGDVVTTGSKNSGPQRLQRMNKDMHHKSWNFVFGMLRKRTCGIALGLVLFSLGAWGQSGNQNEGSPAPTRNPSTSQDQSISQDRPMPETLSPDAGAQEDEPTSEPGQAMAAQSMSAEQIIGILQQEPTALQSIKEQVALQTGADPGSISNESLFARVLQSETVRALATQELSARGYSANRAVTSTLGKQGSRTPQTAGGNGSTLSAPYASPDDPQVQHKTSPYASLPSLSDLYAQFPPSLPKLRRFGSDALLVGSGNASQLPLDLPAGPDYVLGPGDTLMLNLWGSRTDRLSRTIDRQGQVQLPEAGAIMVAGMTIAQAQTEMEKVLNTQFRPRQNMTAYSVASAAMHGSDVSMPMSSW